MIQQIQIYIYKYANTSTQLQIYKYKDTQIQIHKYKYTTLEIFMWCQLVSPREVNEMLSVVKASDSFALLPQQKNS